VPTSQRCADCHGELDPEDERFDPDGQATCPRCGSRSRQFLVSLEDHISIHDVLGTKVRGPHGGKPLQERKSGDELHRDTGEWRDVQRTVDREHDEYHEVITRPTGEVIHEVHEPLSQHRGHGTAASTLPDTPAELKQPD
jgi:DNA-directed RNA polymerase subunit RPC12/RpoP